jgi:hypothetical protein
MYKVQVFDINGELYYINNYDETTYIGDIYRDIQNKFPFDDFKLSINDIIIPLYKKLNELNNDNIELTITKYNNNYNINKYLLMFNKNNEIIFIKPANDYWETEYEKIYNILPNLIPLKIISINNNIIILTINKELYYFNISYPEKIIKYNKIENINNIFQDFSEPSNIIITDNNNNISKMKPDISIIYVSILKNIKNINNILDIFFLIGINYCIIKYLNYYIEMYDINYENGSIIIYENIKEIISGYKYLFLITLDNKIISFIPEYQTIFMKYNFIKIISSKIFYYDRIIGILDNNDIIIIEIYDYKNITIKLINNNDIIKNIIEIKFLYNSCALINDIGDIIILDYNNNINYDFITIKDIIVYTETYKITKYKYDITMSSSIINMKLYLILGKNITNIMNNNNHIYYIITNNNICYIWSMINCEFTEKIINNIKDIILNNFVIVAITYDFNIIIYSINDVYTKRIEKLQRTLSSYNIKKIIGLIDSIIVITLDNKVIQFGLKLEYDKENKICTRIYYDEITHIITC